MDAKSDAVLESSSSSSPSQSLMSLEFEEMERFAEVANELADAAGVVIRKYFRKSFDVQDKEDLSPVTIADQKAEEAMVSILLENLPSHAVHATYFPGAGGAITDWKGQPLKWKASPDSYAPSFNVVATGDKNLLEQALKLLPVEII